MIFSVLFCATFECFILLYFIFFLVRQFHDFIFFLFSPPGVHTHIAHDALSATMEPTTLSRPV